MKVLQCPKCGRLRIVEDYMFGIWCSCTSNPTWVDAEKHCIGEIPHEIGEKCLEKLVGLAKHFNASLRDVYLLSLSQGLQRLSEMPTKEAFKLVLSRELSQRC